MAYLYYKHIGQGGRIGNQLFGIAATIGIARSNGMQPIFPANWKYRQYFNIPDEMFGDCPVQSFYKEPHFHYATPQIDNTKNTELQGYFQSEKYWLHCKDEVLKYLTPKGIEPGSIDAVAIHHRRGDYINNPNYQQLGMGYYISAYNHFFKGKEIRAFSDDPHYIDLHYGGNTLKAKAASDIEDMKNMIACKYHICSNSTFSWWGAYLSGGVVIRPAKYFAGALAERSDDKDLWPGWQRWPELKIRGFRDVTFIIPVMFDHQDRYDNLKNTLAFISKHFNAQVIVGEINGDRFRDLVYDPIMPEAYKHVRFDMPRFHRTKVLNEMTRMSATTYVFNWDADVIISPWQIYAAVEKLRNGADIVYPFDGTVANVPRAALPPFFKTLDCGVFAGKMWPWMSSTYKSVGMAVGYSKESFLKAGGENESFVSYGPEDQERYMRFKRSGLKVERVPGTAFHMEHYRGNNSCERHPNANNNRILFEAELSAYREWCKQVDDKDMWRPFQASTGKICQW